MNRSKSADVQRQDQVLVTAGEHPHLLAAVINDIAARHGVSTPATAHR